MERLDKIVSRYSAYSRREVEKLIRSGQVQVNGAICRKPEAKFDLTAISLSLKGEQLNLLPHRTFMLNKPGGYISATEDPAEKTVLELIQPKDRHPALFPAGRLDKDTEGLLLLTDDGDLCHRIISPKKEIYKTYLLRVQGYLNESDCACIQEGIHLSDGTSFLPGKLTILEQNEVSLATLEIREGQYHQVKRMMAFLGKPVIALKRIAIGGLILDPALAPGEYRLLSDEDIAAVFQQ